MARRAPLASFTFASVLALTSIACGSDAEEMESESGSESESETGDPSEALAQHGTVLVEIGALSGETSVFDGTAQVELTLHYLDCLESFYRGAGLSWRQDGADGAPVFEAYPAQLCPAGGALDCSVSSLTSTVDNVEEEYTLSVRYDISDAGQLEDAQFIAGPLPLEELAGCAPTVQLRSMGVSGLDAQGEPLWRIGTISGSNEATAGDLLPIRVEVVAQ